MRSAVTRRVLASVIDVLLAAALAFVGFRVGAALAPCPNEASCFAQIPLGLGGAVLPVVLYFVLGYRAWGRTPGERFANISTQ